MRKTLQVFLRITIISVLVGLGWMFWPRSDNSKISKELAPAGAEVVAGASTVQQVDQDTPKSQSYSLDVNVSRDRVGNFVGLNKIKAGGTAKLIIASGKRYIRFEDDFFVENASDGYIFVGGQSEPEIEIARLKSTSGGQNYELPDYADSNGFDTVWITSKDSSNRYAKAGL